MEFAEVVFMNTAIQYVLRINVYLLQYDNVKVSLFNATLSATL